MDRCCWVVAFVVACGGEAEVADLGETRADSEDRLDGADFQDLAPLPDTVVDTVGDSVSPGDSDLGPNDANDRDTAETSADSTDAHDVELSPEDIRGDIDVLSGWTWSSLPELPRLLQEHATVALAGEVVMLGGFENLTLVDAVVHYDPVARTFRQGTPLPRPLHHVNAAVVEGRLMVLGALEGFAFAAKGDVWVLEAAGWSPRTSMPTGRQRGSAGVAVVGPDVILVGGFRAGAVNNVDVYRSAEDRWERLPDLPGARDHGGAVALGGLVYAVGGRQGGIGSVEADLWRLDPLHPEAGWTALPAMPTARGGFALGVVDGKIAVVGGEGNTRVASGVFPQAELYDPASNQWLALPEMPAPRHGMQAVALEVFDPSTSRFVPTLFVPGGADVEAFGATRTFQALMAP